MKFIRLFKNAYFWLGLILFIAFLVRLYRIDAPIADWHSWRQVDTAAVTRNFIKEGFNPLIPKFDDMSGISESPIPNPNRFRFVEFPIYNIAVYPFYLLFGINEIYHRLVSVFFSLGSIIFLFLITARYTSKIVGLLASLIFALLPFNIFFSRTVLPEPTFIFFSLGMVYFVDRWIYENKSKYLALGLLFTVTAFLLKPWAIFFGLPLVYSVYRKQGKIWPIEKRFLIFTFFSLLPFTLWRLWILQHPEGIPASSWLYNGDGIRFRPAFWRWIISERIGREILGVSGAILFTIGFVIKAEKNYFLHFWLLSNFLFFAIFATGNVRHDYYQIMFVPIASIFVSLGFKYLITGFSNFIPRFWTIILALILLPTMFYFTWLEVKDLYRINNPSIIKAGKKADEILPKTAIVVAPYNGDTAFLYQINRPGFPFTPLPLTELISKYGVTHYVSTARDHETEWVIRHFDVLVDTEEFVIVDLTKIRKDLDPNP